MNDIIDNAANSAIRDAHDNWSEIYGEPEVGNENQFAQALETLFIEYVMEDTGCDEDEAWDYLQSCDKIQSEIALYTYTGRA